MKYFLICFLTCGLCVASFMMGASKPPKVITKIIEKVIPQEIVYKYVTCPKCIMTNEEKTEALAQSYTAGYMACTQKQQ